MNDARRPSNEHDLDRLLRDWHADNADAARAGRDRLLDAVAAERPEVAGRIDGATATAAVADVRPRPDRPAPRRRRTGPGGASLMPGTGLLAAALFVIVAILAVLVIPSPQNRAFAQLVQIPDGGRLEAFDTRGQLIGPCPLQHTDVDVEISGPIVSVSIRQRYANPYDTPIEAVYTFPMSNRAAVHRMTMTIVDPDGGERVVEGEVKERELARAIYEQAKASGFVASLLEQERPNIFTQSVANIEPGATVTVEIGYLEVIDARDGEYAFEFPTVVGPRYIPGAVTIPSSGLPEGVVPRRGIVLRGPAEIVLEGHDGDDATGHWTNELVQRALASATPIESPQLDPESLGVAASGQATYGDGSKEPFRLLNGGLGEIAGRWFAWRLPTVTAPGEGFAPDTNQVPDASRITPMPVHPSTRAGHDISIAVSIDTGGVAITELDAPLHEVVERRDGDGRVKVALADQATIPNRDFVLRWRLKDDAIAESVFTHVEAGESAGPGATGEAMVPGGYLTMVLAPPARVVPEEVRPRELIFVLDTSGSMSGFPVEKSKAVVNKAIDAMRSNDTFNVITFAGRTKVLWAEPRSATEANRTEAQRFIDGLGGGGGTEMMTAINQALVQTGGARPGPVELANLPADGRLVTIAAPYGSISTADGRTWLVVRDGLRIPMTLPVSLPTMKDADPMVELNGRWLTQDGERRFEVAQASFVESTVAPPMRIAMFFTDGYVGNDEAIIQAVRDNARSTRVFSLGVGNALNRYLLDEMARHGRGAVDYVLLADGADEVVERLAKRIETPVLTDIEVAIEGVESFDILPQNPACLLPDLYDAKPILLHARYTPPTGGPVAGTVVITGNTGAGRYERRIPVTFTADAADHASISTLWGRAKVDQILDPHLAAVQQGSTPPQVKAEVVRFGEAYDLVTRFTSFVAVEKSRVVVGGRPMLVTVPIELPEGTDWNGFFGTDCPPIVRQRAQELAGTPLLVEPIADEAAQADSIEIDAVMDAESLSLEPSTGGLRDSLASETAASGRKRAPTATSDAFGENLWFAQERQAGSGGGIAGRAVAPSGGRGGGGGFGGGGGGGAFGAGPGSGSVGASAKRSGGARPSQPGALPQPDSRPSGVANKSATESPQRESLEGGFSLDEADEEMPAPREDPSGAQRQDVDSAVAASDDSTVADPTVEEDSGPKRDLAKLMATLDRRLLMLALGAGPSEVPGLPGRGLDGRPLIDDGTVAITMLVNGRDRAAIRVALGRLGVRVEGLASAGIGDTMLVVGRVEIDRLLDLGEATLVRRVVPAGDA